jgi:hypothetical protein
MRAGVIADKLTDESASPMDGVAVRVGRALLL